MNVIDRSQMDWHKANKHTMILAKSVNEKDGNTYVEEGISSFSAKPQFVKLAKHYGPWEKYDISITKTGDKANAYIISNATKNPELVEGPNVEYISDLDHLTDEERSWERYDLEKLYRITTNTKIYNKLKETIARIDAALKTNFLDELKAEVDKEKALFDEMYGKEEETTSTPTVTAEDVDSEPLEIPTFDAEEEETPQPTPVRTRATAIPEPSAPGSDLPYYTSIPEELRSKIISATKLPNGKWDIKWNHSNVLACPNKECEAAGPMELTQCPACGMKFV